MNQHARSRTQPGKQPLRTTFLAGLAIWAGLAGAVRAQDPGSYQIVGSVAAYLGVMPAEIVGGHPTYHPEARMHGGPPAGVHSEHIVIALFEDPSGTRIEDAKVEMTVAGLGGVGITPITLDPMLIAGVITYGGYVKLDGADTYSLDLKISRPASAVVTKMRFNYQHASN